jgi:hypothetical protein
MLVVLQNFVFHGMSCLKLFSSSFVFREEANVPLHAPCRGRCTSYFGCQAEACDIYSSTQIDYITDTNAHVFDFYRCKDFCTHTKYCIHFSSAQYSTGMSSMTISTFGWNDTNASLTLLRGNARRLTSKAKRLPRKHDGWVHNECCECVQGS